MPCVAHRHGTAHHNHHCWDDTPTGAIREIIVTTDLDGEMQGVDAIMAVIPCFDQVVLLMETVVVQW